MRTTTPHDNTRAKAPYVLGYAWLFCSSLFYPAYLTRSDWWAERACCVYEPGVVVMILYLAIQVARFVLCATDCVRWWSSRRSSRRRVGQQRWRAPPRDPGITSVGRTDHAKRERAAAANTSPSCGAKNERADLTSRPRASYRRRTRDAGPVRSRAPCSRSAPHRPGAAVGANDAPTECRASRRPSKRSSSLRF